MKKLSIYLLLIWLCGGQSLIAQTTKTEPLELRFLYFSLLTAPPEYFSRVIADNEWFQAQKDAWETELKKDKRSERAWENYMLAFDVVRVAEKDSLQRPKLEKEWKKLMKEMKQYIPHTRFYYQYLQAQTTDRRERDALQQKIASLKRTNERDYLSDMDYYIMNHQKDNIEKLAREWYESRMYSSNLLFYCYNELVGLKEHAVFVSDMNQGTYYRYLLQYGMGLFKDVEIVTPSDLTNPNKDSDFWKGRGVDLSILPDQKENRYPGAWYLEQKEKRPVYFTQLLGNKYLIDDLKDILYPEGLVFRYSSKPYNNMAALRKNYEQNYLLDYIRRPLLKYDSILADGTLIQMNYVVGFSPLLQFYKVSGDKNQYVRLKSFLQGILDHFGKDGQLLNKEVMDGRKLVESIQACMLKQKEAGNAYVETTNMVEEYQKLIDPEEP